MSISKNKLNEYIDLYLNDIDDYGNDNDVIIAESIFKPFKGLILESKIDPMVLLLEIKNKSNSTDKLIIEDFILYLNNI